LPEELADHFGLLFRRGAGELVPKLLTVLPKRLDRAWHALYVLPRLSRVGNDRVNELRSAFQARPRPLRKATAVRKDPVADPPALDILPEHRSEVELLDAAVAAKDSGSAIANR